jgi:hypothetical protein
MAARKADEPMPAYGTKGTGDTLGSRSPSQYEKPLTAQDARGKARIGKIQPVPGGAPRPRKVKAK